MATAAIRDFHAHSDYSDGLFTTSGTDFHDPFHRGCETMGKDKQGEPMRNGYSIAEFQRLGAYAHV